MKKSVCLGGLAVALLGLGVARGQGPAYPTGGQGTPPPGSVSARDMGLGTAGAANPATAGLGAVGLVPGSSPAAPPPAYGIIEGGQGGQGAPPPSQVGMSSWLVYPRAFGCCGPLGANGPISSEIYVRSGVSFPVGPGFFGASSLHTGWAIQGGGRVLFFNPEVDAAWTVDLSVSNVEFGANHRNVARLFNVTFGNNPPTPEVDVTLQGVNQTYANLAGGREWYLLGTGYGSVGPVWRAGVDLGGRYGTTKVDLDQIRHRTGQVGGLFGAIHTDLECPCCGVIFVAGVRAEYGYIWSDVLQRQNNTDLQTINLLANFGIRF